MYVTVNEGLTQQIAKTAHYLTRLEASGNRDRNDRERFRPTLETLDQYAVAVQVARVPLTSFIGTDKAIGARFEMGNGSRVAIALDRAVGFLMDRDATNVPDSSLSMYEFKRTAEVLALLKELHFGVLANIRKAAEEDLRQMVSEDVERFLSTAELIRSWASRSGSDEDDASSDDR